jgi:hypothetical protein
MELSFCIPVYLYVYLCISGHPALGYEDFHPTYVYKISYLGSKIWVCNFKPRKNIVSYYIYDIWLNVTRLCTCRNRLGCLCDRVGKWGQGFQALAVPCLAAKRQHMGNDPSTILQYHVVYIIWNMFGNVWLCLAISICFLLFEISYRIKVSR